MYIYQVIPLTKIPRPHTQLPSYFSANEFEVGQFVEVPLGKRNVIAAIAKKEKATNKKQEIRKSSFTLKKVARPLTQKAVLSKEFLKLAQDLADYYYTSYGLILQRMLPPEFARPTGPLLSILNSLDATENKKRDDKQSQEKVLYIGKRKKDTYRRYLKNKVLMLVPEHLQIEGWRDKFSDHNSWIADENKKKTEIREAWRKAYEGNLDKILGTRSSLFLPLKNIQSIVIENENSDGYLSWDQHPKIDMRHAANIIAIRKNTDFIKRDTIVSMQAYWQAKKEGWNIKKNISLPNKSTEIVDMREEIQSGNTSILSEKLSKNLVSLKNTDSAFLFIARRGIASALVCRDCGHIFRCGDCTAPLVMHKNKLICHHCGRKEIPPQTCPQCRGYKIKYLGGGTQRVKEEVEKLRPDLNIVALDTDTAPTQKEQKNILENFKDKKINILIGTNRALKETFFPQLNYAAVVMLDTITILPSYKSSENAFEIMWRLKVHSTNLDIQTYHPELPPFQNIQKDDFESFFEEELKKRKTLKWPPFAQIVRCIYAHKDPQKAEREANTLKRKLDTQLKSLNIESSNFNVQIMGPAPGYIEKVKGKHIWYLLIKWPKPHGDMSRINDRNALLRVIPSDWEVVVDPIDIA